FCDYVLSKWGVGHRGTHGACDDGWHPPNIQFLTIKDELSTKRLASEHDPIFRQQVAMQHRELSTDTFEIEIQISQESTLAELKQSLGLYDTANETSLLGDQA